MTNTFPTTLIWPDSTGGEHEADVRVTYTFHRGYADTWDEPGCADSVEIQRITGDVPALFYTDPGLIAECFEDYAAAQDDARERAWEARRDDAMMERFRD